jgi:hypothetical protein
MCKIAKIVGALIIFTFPALAQNEIDHIATLWPSGYGKLAIDGDTLYVNTLNGHGVERYDIANPANPIFIDREEVSGFDQIDFNRRVMAKFEINKIVLIGFNDFDSTMIFSNILVQIPLYNWLPWGNWPPVKLADNYLYISSNDSIRVYNIVDPSNPFLCDIIRANRTPIGWGTVFGSTVCIIGYDYSQLAIIDIYNISDPNNIYYTHSDSVFHGGASGYGIGPARGDTMAAEFVGQAGYSWTIQLISYAPNDTTHLPYWGEGHDGQPQGLYSNDNGFVRVGGNVGTIAHSFNNFTTLGKVPDPFSYGGDPYTFDCTADDHFIASFLDSLCVFQPTYSDSLIMPQVAKTGPAHSGILSTASYGNYLLSGAESNGGELLIHQLDQSNQLNLLSVVPNVKAKKIVVVGSSAICLCPNKFSQINISNPSEPVISHEISGFSGELLDFAYHDSLIYAITDRAYYVIDYDSLSGMTVLSQMSFPANSLTSIGQFNTASVLLQGSLAHLIKISSVNPTLPVIIQEKQLRPDTFQFMNVMYAGIWASSRHGTDVFGIYDLDSTAFFGLEYFSDVHDMSFNNDTLYVADGIAGIKVFKYFEEPADSLHFIGGYSTGNVVNQLATIGNNFFVSDYYSLQHLCWGAPTGIETQDNPNTPREFTLLQNYPNPFNAQTTISYNLTYAAEVTLDIYDILGRKIQTLVSGLQSAGSHDIIWNAGDIASGIYFYKINSNGKSKAGHCLLLK